LSWQDQGRQAHGRFGHGHSAHDQSNGDKDVALFDPASTTQRIDYVANSVVGHMPPRLRSHAAASPDSAARGRLRTVMSAWHAAADLNRDAFRRRFLDPYASDETTDLLREAARRTADARTHQDLGEAGAALTEAELKLGLTTGRVSWRMRRDGPSGQPRTAKPTVIKSRNWSGRA